MLTSSAHSYKLCSSILSISLSTYGGLVRIYIIHLILIGLGCFLIYTPLCYVRKIEKFAVFHIFADVIILVTVATCITYTCIY
jgi:hypothetical protein